MRINKLFKDKKGNFADIPIFIVSALAIGFGLIITLLFLDQFNDNIQANSAIPNETQQGINEYNTLLETTSDYILPIITLGFFAFSIFSARLIPSSPKFMIIGVLAVILLPLVAMMFANIWDGFIQQATVKQISDGLIFTPFILNNIVFVSLVYSVSVAIALFTKEDLGR